MRDLDGRCGLSGVKALLNGAEVRLKSERLASGMRDIRRQTDFFCVNLECALSGRGEQIEDKKFTLRALPHYVLALKELGINIACLANNHILDYGPESLEDTVEVLEKAGISHLGLRHDQSHHPEPLIVEKEGEKVAVLNFVEPAIIDPNPDVFMKHNPCPYPLIPEIIYESIERHAPELPVVVVLHWGEEWSFLQNDKMRRIARACIDHGASAVIGHHTHLAGGIEEYNGRPIAYGLGNLSMSLPPFSQRRSLRRLMANLTFKDKQLVAYEFIPLISDADECPIVSPVYRIESLYDDYLPQGIDQGAILFDSFHELDKAELKGTIDGEKKTARWYDDYQNLFEIIQGKLPLGHGLRFDPKQWNGVAQARDLMGGEFLLSNVAHIKEDNELVLRFKIPEQSRQLRLITGYPQWFRPREEFAMPEFSISVHSQNIFQFNGNLPGPEWRIDSISIGNENNSPVEIEMNFKGTAGKLSYLAWRLMAM